MQKQTDPDLWVMANIAEKFTTCITKKRNEKVLNGRSERSCKEHGGTLTNLLAWFACISLNNTTILLCTNIGTCLPNPRYSQI